MLTLNKERKSEKLLETSATTSVATFVREL